VIFQFSKHPLPIGISLKGKYSFFSLEFKLSEIATLNYIPLAKTRQNTKDSLLTLPVSTGTLQAPFPPKAGRQNDKRLVIPACPELGSGREAQHSLH